MRIRRRLHPALLVWLLSGAMLTACGENPPTGLAIESDIVVTSAGPVGVSPDNQDKPWKYAVNSIDSVMFHDGIDSTALEVTSFQLTDPEGRLVPGTTRFVPEKVYIRYTRAFPDPSYELVTGSGGSLTGQPVSKVYFLPDSPLHGRAAYTYTLTTGLRMVAGRFERDQRSFTFTTGDSVTPPPE